MSKLRVWHIVNVPNNNTFNVYVQDLEEAKKILNLLWRYDNYLGDGLIDSNASGLEVLEDGEWVEWMDDQCRDIGEVMRFEEDDNYCPDCDDISEDGCIHRTVCCGTHVIPCTDLCSDCKEHTGYADV